MFGNWKNPSAGESCRCTSMLWCQCEDLAPYLTPTYLFVIFSYVGVMLQMNHQETYFFFSKETRYFLLMQIHSPPFRWCLLTSSHQVNSTAKAPEDRHRRTTWGAPTEREFRRQVFRRSGARHLGLVNQYAWNKRIIMTWWYCDTISWISWTLKHMRDTHA